MKFADPKSDVAFKKIFGNENRKGILISFLNAVLDLTGDRAIEDVDILNLYQAPRIVELKETTLDVKARDRRGVIFIVEMQVERQEYFGKRALYYASKAYVSQIERSADYPKLNQVIFIGILDFDFFESNHYLSRHLIINEENRKQELRDLEFNFIELKKFTKDEDELDDVIDKWTFFLKNAENLDVIPENLRTPDEIREAFEAADRHNWTKTELEVYDYWDMEEGKQLDVLNTARKEGMEKGIAEGIEKGIEQGMLEDAREMVIEALREHYRIVPVEVVDRIGLIEKREVLKGLLRQAIKYKDIEEFQQVLQKVN